MTGIAIIGCGLIGQRRASLLKDHAILKNNNVQLLACVDTHKARADTLAAQHAHCTSYTQWQEVIARTDIDVIIIAVLHAYLGEIGLAALNAGKHVLIEKPAAKHSSEISSMIAAAQKTNTLARVGFNHRYHRAFRKAKALVEANELGELMFIRARYGHGGRIGYEQEWRANPELSGGGELMDQGVHLIDLARWFLGDFKEIEGFAHTYYWNMPVDDNGFLLLKTATKQAAFLHASCTEWKNTFSFEIYGKQGKIEINGLGGSYGVEKIIFYKMLPTMGPPETYAWEFPMNDNSWESEFSEFLEDIALKRQPAAGLQDAYQALKIVEEIYARPTS